MTRRHLLKLVLALALLAGQGLFLFHQAQHFDAIGGHDCPICAQAQAYRAEAAPALPSPVYTPALGGVAPIPFVACRGLASHAFLARAPPLLTPPPIDIA